MGKYLLVIDQGTTSSRVLFINKQGKALYKQQMEISLIECKDGRIVQNPEEIINSVKVLIEQAFLKSKIKPIEVEAIGITNQRETTIIWDRKTGKPIYQAISWQSKHTYPIAEQWIKEGLKEKVFQKTGLEINPYFSASKIRYILDQVKSCDDLMFGTVDTFLLYHLTNGKSFKTDVTNAARTMLFNIETLKWDDELLDLFKIPRFILPEVVANDSYFGDFVYDGVKIPIMAMIGDQQSSLFGHQAFLPGQLKCTYGTGGFILVNIGENIKLSKNKLLTTVAWQINGKTSYALEGSIFICGAIVQWLRDEMKIIRIPKESEKLSLNSSDNDVYVVPAFVGLGTPYWDSEVKAAIFNLKRKTTRNDIVRASLNSIVYQIEEILALLKEETLLETFEMSADGGASENNYLMQFQSDISNININQTEQKEVTALGAGYIAGLKTGFFKNTLELKRFQKIKKIFYPEMEAKERERLFSNWKQAVRSAQSFKLIKEEK